MNLVAACSGMLQRGSGDGTHEARPDEEEGSSCGSVTFFTSHTQHSRTRARHLDDGMIFAPCACCTRLLAKKRVLFKLELQDPDGMPHALRRVKRPSSPGEGLRV